MTSRILPRWTTAAAPLFAACMLLEPYPGGGDPAQALVGGGAGPSGGTPQDPLIDPPEDGSIGVVNLLECDDPDKKDGCTLALPGTGFPIHLGFTAPAKNVVGGGIRIEGSTEVQWTLLAEVKDQASGEIQFAYVLPEDVCDGIPNLCHVIETEQFAVASDGAGGFAVSKPVKVNVVLQCATCDSQSCVDALPASACQACIQPQACKDLYDACYAPGKPGEGTEAASLFDTFLGPNGTLWSSEQGCVQGEALCQQTLDQMSCTF